MFEVLLGYYDKHYAKALNNRPHINEVLIRIPASDIDAAGNTTKILEANHESAPTRN